MVLIDQILANSKGQNPKSVPLKAPGQHGVLFTEYICINNERGKKSTGQATVLNKYLSAGDSKF